MVDPLRVGVVGRTGHGNYGHGIDTAWRDVPGTVVVAVADDDPQGRAQAKDRLGASNSYSDYHEMLMREDLDLVAIGPRWIDQHYDMMMAAIEHGCHIFTEKPFCRTLQEADALIAASEMRHLKIAIAHQTRYSPLVRWAQNQVAAGAIGDLMEIRGRGKEDHRGGGEDLWVLGAHLFDTMRLFAGDPDECYATVRTNGHLAEETDIVPIGNEGLGPLWGDTIDARYSFGSGVVGYFGTRRNQAGEPSRFGLQLFGSRGVMDVGFGYMADVYLLRDPGWSPGRNGTEWEKLQVPPSAREDVHPKTTRSIDPLHLGNVAAIRDLIESIQNQRQPKCSPYDGRWTLEMILGVFSSHRQRKPVQLPLIERRHPLERPA